MPRRDTNGALPSMPLRKGYLSNRGSRHRDTELSSIPKLYCSKALQKGRLPSIVLRRVAKCRAPSEAITRATLRCSGSCHLYVALGRANQLDFAMNSSPIDDNSTLDFLREYRFLQLCKMKPFPLLHMNRLGEIPKGLNDRLKLFGRLFSRCTERQ